MELYMRLEKDSPHAKCDKFNKQSSLLPQLLIDGGMKVV